MADPFLDAHRVLPGLHLIGFPVAPISIRDQMLRGRLIIDRALEVGLISPGQKEPVLIVGAGAGGATAAIRAAQRGLTTLLIELAPAPFSIQARAPTRWVDPTQYDFPTNHWRESRMPWRSPTMPLRWHADYAHHLAAAWTVQLNRNLRAYRKLWAVFGIQITGITPTGSFGAPFSVSFSRNVPFKGPFWFILWAAGFGEETCTVKGPTNVYRGFPFWSTDPYGLPNLGLGSNTSSKVLIAGGGDGALQDFLRITTGYQSAKDLYDHCNIPEEVRKEIQEEIYSAEDQARRAGSWSAHTRHDHDVQVQLQAAHVTAVTKALNQPDVEKALAKLLKGGASEVKLVYRCEHFTNYYGLNRFLVLLVAHYIAKRDNIRVVDVLMPQKSVEHVRPAAHAASHTCGAPLGCHGIDHEVDLRSEPFCWKTGSSTGISSTIPVNVVVIRYGVDRRTSTFPLPTPLRPLLQLSRPQHLLPYYLPA